MDKFVLSAKVDDNIVVVVPSSDASPIVSSTIGLPTKQASTEGAMTLAPLPTLVKKRILVEADDAMSLYSGSEEEEEDDEDFVDSGKKKKTAVARKTPPQKKTKVSAPLSTMDQLLGQATKLEKAMEMLSNMDHAALLKAAKEMCTKLRFDVEPDRIDQSVMITKKTIVKNLRSAMVWKKSCKGGGAQFKASVTCAKPVFDKIFGTSQKKIKLMDQRKMPCEEFWTALGQEVSGSTRYGSLDASGNIAVRYNVETSELNVSGKYGC